ncbi:MAG: hypothetical protein ACRDYE_05915, partial [Acidimicrobiales bacterium]
GVVERGQTISYRPCTTTAPRRPGGMTRSNCSIVPTVADSGGPWICALTGGFARLDSRFEEGPIREVPGF